MPYREQNSNKGTFGKVLNISGSKNYIGAVYLSSAAVLKIGAGLVGLATTQNIINSVSQLLPEAVFYERNEIKEQVKNYSTILIGCGLGLQTDSIRLFEQAIKLINKENLNIVIDADGLSILAKLYKQKNKAIIEFAKNLDKKLILTPHPKEASRLLDIELDEILQNPKEAAQKISEKYHCVCVLKMHQTIVYGQNGELYINEHGNSALAKAGTGDVLAGIISGLLAQKMNIFEAAKLGVYIHSISGEIASEKLTQYCVLASDLLNYIPQAVKTII